MQQGGATVFMMGAENKRKKEEKRRAWAWFWTGLGLNRVGSREGI